MFPACCNWKQHGDIINRNDATKRDVVQKIDENGKGCLDNRWEEALFQSKNIGELLLQCERVVCYKVKL